MDHDEVREQLEAAAVEPGGLDRLMAGDTAVAAAIAAHLAGCDACTTELERLRRAVPLISDVVRTTPPADLRERTLAFVLGRGIDRSPGALTAVGPAVATAPAAPEAAGRGRSVLPWVASIAAAVVLSVLATSFLVGQRFDEQLAAQDEAIDQLGHITTSTLLVTGEPDAERVALESTDGSMAAGTLVFSPGITELVVTATGLTEPPAGQEYRCWVERNGERESIGKMFFGGDLAYWAGEAESVADLPAGTSFGVSITEVGGTSLDAPPVISGTL